MIHNKTQGFTLISHQRIAKSFFALGRGLTFRLKPDYALVMVLWKEMRITLTMWFVFFPIDVLFLDSQKKVVEIKKDFRPFTNYKPSKEAKYIVEFPCGLLGKTKEGDEIEINGL